MMKSRKRRAIAVCVAGYSWECETRIINGILRKCQKNDVNLLIFSSLMLRGDFPKGIEVTKNLVRGEAEIFNLINYDLVDGVIVFGGSIYRKESINEIAAACEAHKIPCINVNDPANILKHNVFIENSYAMELVVEHLVKVHGLKRIDFIGGYPDNKETIERLNAYRKILTENGIPVEDRRIKYGHFWNYAVECAKQFLEDEVPEAIVCANDTMAILVSNYLRNQGYKIPNDIIVTGFDGISDADSYRPALTTVRPDFDSTGAKTYELLEELMRGKDQAKDIYIHSELVVQESCGCMHYPKKEHNFVEKFYGVHSQLQLFHKQLIKQNIYFSDAVTSGEMFFHLLADVGFFGVKSFAFCINSEIEDKADYFKGGNYKYGISDKVYGTIVKADDSVELVPFESKNLYWDDLFNRPEPIVMAFSPLYYNSNYLGYMAYEPTKLQGEGEHFLIWVQNAANEIGSFYLKKELEKNSLQDFMTGLYNRRGMEQMFPQIIETAQNNREFLCVTNIDVDNLKQINDNFGHEAGDNAIIQLSTAIKKVFDKNSVCVRTGGDEFCVLTHSDKKINGEKLRKAIDAELNEYNKKSNQPYEICCSCGSCIVDAKNIVSIDQLKNEADKVLYIEKEKHHRRCR